MLIPVWLDEQDRLMILDQTRFPAERVELELHSWQSLWDAILHLQVRGAPAIGVCAAYGVYMLAKQAADKAALLQQLTRLRTVRPTAVNLNYALDRMAAVLAQTEDAALLPALRQEACAIDAAEQAISRKLGELGFSLMQPGMGVLTHCNAGALAAGPMGTALAPLYHALAQGLPFTVYCDETRPLLQGARLTAWEMQQAGANTVLLCDNAAASLMAAGHIQAVFVGADRICANGDAVNKIGTLSVAVNAKRCGIPFYVFAPSSTVDIRCKSGADVPIEQRSGEEVTHFWYQQPMAPEGVRVYSPAFDVTPADLITAIVTETGIHRPPYRFG